jgi:hypothetical protein
LGGFLLCLMRARFRTLFSQKPSNPQHQQSSMSSPPSPLVWFLLVDPVTGELFKRTSADAVSLPPGSVVVQFRDAVQAKYDKPNYLKDIPSGALIVYKNKAAFVKRNAAPEEGKEEPLEEDCLIDGLGISMKEALIVVVPSSIQFAQAWQPSSFPPCQIPFYNNVFSAIEQDGWISFGQTIPLTTLNKLYIRESYLSIASSIQSGIKKAMITGTPGIGKSMFLIYLLWNLLKQRKRVLLIYHPFIIYYDGKGGVFQFPAVHLPLETDYSFWNETLWCLFDAKGKKESDLNKFPYDLCTFILSTSPRREMVNDFKKPPEPEFFYMPTWSQAELEAIAPLFPDATEWRSRFDILGGIPRHVLEVTRRDPTEMIEAACEDCSLDDCMKKIGLISTITEKSKIIHTLIHMTSVPPYTSSSVSYASPTARNIIARLKGNEAKHKMRDLLASCEGNPLTASLCGYIFESFAIELLEKGGQFTCRQLIDRKQKIKPDETPLTIPASKKTVVDRVVLHQTRKQLHVPRTKTYTAIDAWIPGIGAFQMTVGKKHDINASVKDDLAKLGRRANKFYWLLPPLYYHDFTKKSPTVIDQYAVLIPYPE